MQTRSLVAATVALGLAAVACSSDGSSNADAPAATSTPGASSGPAGTGGAADGGEFTMLSYNVAGLPQEISTEQPQMHLPLISPLLDDYDIVVTQEDFDWWADAVAELDFVHYHERLRADTTQEHRTEQHPGPAAVGIDGSDPDRPLPLVGDGLGVLSRFPISDVVRVPWPHCFGGADTSDHGAGDCLAMKGFLVATVDLTDGVEVDLYTLHVEAGSSDADQELQAEDIRTLSDFMTEHSSGRAVIIGGDTNLHLEPGHEDEPLDRPIWEGLLSEQGLTDVCAVVECPADGTIDKVAWRDGDGLTLEPTSFTWEAGFVDADGADLSDHPAVAVGWRWHGPGA